ncbi:hypothetical protein D3C72_1521550 [compost metagenome]
MEDAIGHHLHAQIAGTPTQTGKKVMPLQNLMQQDAVKEPAHANAQKKTRPGSAARQDRGGTAGRGVHVDSGCEGLGTTVGACASGSTIETVSFGYCALAASTAASQVG